MLGSVRINHDEFRDRVTAAVCDDNLPSRKVKETASPIKAKKKHFGKSPDKSPDKGKPGAKQLQRNILAETSGSLRAFNETTNSVRMLDIVEETYGERRLPAMITEKSELEIKSKEGALPQGQFGDEFSGVEDPLNADLILANIALDKGMYDAFKNLRQGVHKPEQKQALQREIHVMHELSDEEPAVGKKQLSISKYAIDRDTNNDNDKFDAKPFSKAP